MTPLLTRIALCLVLAGLAGGRVSAEPAPLTAIPADVVDIRLFGSWEEDGASGIYRGIVTVPQPGKATFTLQWIAVNADGVLATVRHSLAIPEIAEIDGVIVDYRSEAEQGGLTVFIDMQAAADAIEETYVVFVEGPDAYMFESASN